MKEELQIKCPHCTKPVDINSLLYQQLSDEVNKDYTNKYFLLSQQEAQLKETITNEVNSKLTEEKQKLENCLRKRMNEEKLEELEMVKHQLQLRKDESVELYKAKAELEHSKRQTEELNDKLTMEFEQKYSSMLKDERQKIKSDLENGIEFKIREREILIEQLKTQLADATRRIDNSGQYRGEAQEMEIIDVLREFHPTDSVTQTKKGANGADVLHTVKTQMGIIAGTINYESKRTKTWSQEWIFKFKQDNLNTKADILVLVTQTLPNDIKRYGIVDNVWVCDFSSVKELSLALRFGLLRLQSVATAQQGKTTKMELLYTYLTSDEFKNLFESIFQGFRTIQDSHNSEKLKLQRLWREREKTLEQVISQSAEFYGAIKGISAGAISGIPSLELPESEQTDQD